MEITIHPLTQNPTEAWKELCKTQIVSKIEPEAILNPLAVNKVRIVCMSDTHGATNYIQFKIPDGDIFIHAGDFTKWGGRPEVEHFNNWLKSLPHKHKIVIAGNHELTFDMQAASTQEVSKSTINPKQTNTPPPLPNVRNLLTDCTYIEDELLEICGLKIYGTPWQPEFCSWAFNLPRGQACLDKWNKIPADIDILITHSPPLGHGDLTVTGQRAGCVELLSTVQNRVKPKYHIFGHIHEGYGITTDGKVIFVNASTCDIKYKPINPPIVFDLSLQEVMTKDSI